MLNQDLKSKISNGFRWSFARQLVAQLCNFCFGIFLARLLSPEDYGLIAMITVFTGLAGVLQEGGLSSAFIHFDDPKEEEVSTAFWLAVILALAISGLLYISGPWIAAFYANPALIPLVGLLAIHFFLSSTSAFPRTMIRKQLRFKQLFWINIIALVIAGIASILMALDGWGVYSIIGRLLLSSVIGSVLAWIVAKWWPKPIFRRSLLKKWTTYSLPLVGNNVLNYFVRNIDDLLVGKYFGGTTLGNYNRAYSLMLLPVRQMTSVFSQVLFPSLAILKEDTEKGKALFLTIIQLIAFVSFPAMLALSVLAEPFVLTLLGTKWSGVIPILQILSLLGAVQSVGSLQGNVYLAQGATALQFKVGVVSKLFMIISIFVGLQWGVLGVTIAYTTASSIAFFWEFYFMGQLINLPVKTVLSVLKTIFLFSLLMFFFLWGIDDCLRSFGASIHGRLLVGIFSGVSFYLGSHAIFKTAAWSLCLKTIKQQLQK